MASVITVKLLSMEALFIAQISSYNVRHVNSSAWLYLYSQSYSDMQVPSSVG